MDGFLQTFGGTRTDDSRWTFDLDKRFNGAFGGTNGGVLSAISLYAARCGSSRRGASIDSRYVRGFRPGSARVEVIILNEGRTLTVARVEVFDTNDRLCTHSTVTLVDAAMLVDAINLEDQIQPPDDLCSYDDGKPWRQPKAMQIPLIDTFAPRAVAGRDNSTTTATKVIWEEPGTTSEAACIAADISVGPPVARAVRGEASTPNPDLSLRFCDTVLRKQHLNATCELQTINNGLASTRIAVFSEHALVAIGISSTTCLPLQEG